MPTAIVTGAASGMGRILAERLAQRSYRVHALDRDGAALEVLAKEADAVVPHQVDVTDTEALVSVLTPLADAADLVVTAAGIGHTAKIIDTPAETYARLMAINYLGTTTTVGAVLPAMLQRRSGRLVLFASMAGWVPAKAHGPYGATKAALVYYAEVLRAELRGTGVSVSCVCPPAVATPLLDDMPVAKQSLGLVKAMTPEAVVDAIEKAIDDDRFWVFPDATSKVMWRLRRHTPRVLDGAISRLVKA